MRIAVFVENSLNAGGAFQQTLSTIQDLASLVGHEVVVMTPIGENLEVLRKHEIEAHLYTDGVWSRFWDTISALMPRLEKPMSMVRRLGGESFGRNLDQRLAKLGIDVAFFNARSSTALRLSRHPYVFTVWDLCHRDYPEFPEVFKEREFELREQVLKAVLPKAFAVIADSDTGADKIAQWYGVDRSRLHVIPFLPSAGVRAYARGVKLSSPNTVREKYQLPEDFFFYPAQMWSHKNHQYLFEGLAELKIRYGLSPAIALGGSDKGNMDYLHRSANSLGIGDQVFFLGFVEDCDIPALYEGARALVMPSYFGPTNLPPLEAALLGCPVIYSDLPSFRNQMKDAALYCDLNQPESLAEHLRTVLQDEVVVKRLKSAGYELTKNLINEDGKTELKGIFESYEYKRRRWRA